jgi:hypothetical protein
MKDLKNVTFETNATQSLREDFKDYLNNQERFTVTWSCSPKLSVSGELTADAIKPGTVADYAGVNNSELYLKFVVADRVDVDEVSMAVQAYRDAGVECPVYLMPLGGRSVKSIRSMFNKLPNFVWNEVGASHQDYTSVSSETLGEPRKRDRRQEQLERAMKHPIDPDKLRKAGM